MLCSNSSPTEKEGLTLLSLDPQARNWPPYFFGSCLFVFLWISCPGKQESRTAQSVEPWISLDPRTQAQNGVWSWVGSRLPSPDRIKYLEGVMWGRRWGRRTLGGSCHSAPLLPMAVSPVVAFLGKQVPFWQCEHHWEGERRWPPASPDHCCCQASFSLYCRKGSLMFFFGVGACSSEV